MALIIVLLTREGLPWPAWFFAGFMFVIDIVSSEIVRAFWKGLTGQ